MIGLESSPSGASGTCPVCGTVYDLHGVDLLDICPPLGDGCDACNPGETLEESSPKEWERRSAR